MKRMLAVVVIVLAAVGANAPAEPLASANRAAVSSRANWNWPIAGAHRILRPFIAPVTVYSAGHRGIDIAADGSLDVRAPADGVVRYAGVVVDRPVLSIEHADGAVSSYEPVVSPLHKGELVARGQVVGELLPGHCSHPCLHFGVRVNGRYVSPLLYLGGIPWSVLLPTRRAPP
jgi:murein DD-endopeptidase MepM/ murein hydrolase activator NlpD